MGERGRRVGRLRAKIGAEEEEEEEEGTEAEAEGAPLLARTWSVLCDVLAMTTMPGRCCAALCVFPLVFYRR